MSNTFSLSLGVLADPIGDQLARQGFILKAADAKMLERDADAISRLLVRSFISTSVATKAREKLMKKVRSALES